MWLLLVAPAAAHMAGEGARARHDVASVAPLNPCQRAVQAAHGALQPGQALSHTHGQGLRRGCCWAAAAASRTKRDGSAALTFERVRSHPCGAPGAQANCSAHRGVLRSTGRGGDWEVPGVWTSVGFGTWLTWNADCNHG